MRMIALILIFVILIIAGSFYFYKQDVKRGDSVEELKAGEEQQVRQTVESFGLKMKNVSVLAPEDVLRESIRTNYGEYVTEALLEEWLDKPTKAPGRQTSSPWPERIEVLSIKKASDNLFEVEAEVIEITSADTGTGESIKRPIKLIVENVFGAMKISKVTLGE